MKKILKNVYFTKSETRVILFLISVLVAGFTIKYYKQVILQEEKGVYDFTKKDEDFRKKSLALLESENIEDDSLYFEKISKHEADQLETENAGVNQTQSLLININTATLDELTELPGIGESIAERIIAHRQKNGFFKKTDDLLKVKGIGKKKFEKLKNLIKTEQK